MSENPKGDGPESKTHKSESEPHTFQKGSLQSIVEITTNRGF